MGSDESHFNVSVGSDGQSQDSVHKPQPFWREKGAEVLLNRGPSAYQPNALTSSQVELEISVLFYTLLQATPIPWGSWMTKMEGEGQISNLNLV